MGNRAQVHRRVDVTCFNLRTYIEHRVWNTFSLNVVACSGQPLQSLSLALPLRARRSFAGTLGDALADAGVEVEVAGVAFTAPVVTFFSLDAYDFGCTLGVACAVSLDGFPGNATTHAVLLPPATHGRICTNDVYTASFCN